MQRQEDKLTTLADGSSAWWRKAKALARKTTPAEPIPEMTNDGSYQTKRKRRSFKFGKLLCKAMHSSTSGRDWPFEAMPSTVPSFTRPTCVGIPSHPSSTVFHHFSRLSTTKSTADKIITKQGSMRMCLTHNWVDYISLQFVHKNQQVSYWLEKTLLSRPSSRDVVVRVTHPTTDRSHYCHLLGR